MGVRRIKDLEKYVLRCKTVREFAKLLDLPVTETKVILVENDVIPSVINKEKFLEMRKTKTMEQMAEYYRVPLSTLNKVCGKQKVNKKLSDISKSDLLRECNKGKTIAELANKYDVSYATMRKYLQELNIPVKNETRRLDKKVIKTLVKQGLTIKEISRKLNCTEPAIRYYVKGRKR
jgi:DNA-binding NarL/FixJ family response regulator